MCMVFAARTGPLGSSVHFWEFSAGQDGCIRAGHTILVPRTPLTGDLGRRANPVRTKSVPRAAPDPKMTSISAMPPDCSGTGRAHGAEYSIFCTAQAGVHQDRKEHLNFFCNLQLEVCKTLRESIADVPIERAEQQRFHPAPKSSREGTLLTNPHRQTNAARAPSQNMLPEPRLTVRHEY